MFKTIVMFRTVALFVMSILCVCAAFQCRAQTRSDSQKPKQKTKVETQYDEKKNQTLARIGPFELWRPPENSVSGEINYERIHLSVSFLYSGKRIVRPKVVTLMVFAASEGGAQFDRSRDLSVSSNSRQYDLGEMELVGKSEGRVVKSISRNTLVLLVSESLRKEISFDEFVQIARFEKADMKIGKRNLKIEKKYLEAFRNFVFLMEQQGVQF
ncbi:MAG TPA: hypothetical protein VFH31_13275 [Pyrinomonadaceae bacterium]|nr:hypothetical protein [Pyrinomonadaceae bacterium]